MSDDDHTFGTVLSLVVGGAAGYAAGRWIVEPWLAARPSAKSISPRRSLATGLIDPQFGPSGEMKPIDPYAGELSIGPSGAMSPIDPYGAVPSPAAVVATTALAETPSVPSSAPTDGPITSPSQVDASLVAPTRTDGPSTSRPPKPSLTAPPSSSGKFATSARVRRFDPVFDRYRGGLSREYLRALVERESDGRPDVRTGSAVGLMQIIPVVLDDYNKRHGTAYQSAQLVDPAINVAIGCELLRLIAGSYRKNHPRIPDLQPDWDNPRFVELLTFGWNAGFSEAGGVGRVARYLEQLGAVDITLDLVTAHARLAGASKHLSNPAKVAWCKSVVALYQRERALAAAPASLATS